MAKMPTTHIYWTDQRKVTNEDIAHAEWAIEEAINQIDSPSLDTELTVRREHALSGNWNNYETYNDFFNQFKDEVVFTNGHSYILIYNKGFIQGTSLSDEGIMGNTTGGALTPFDSPRSVVNADLATLEPLIFRNTVKHEWLHHLTCDHSDGAQYGWLDENSPLVTGYAESIRGGNPKPPYLCNGDAKTSNTHNGTISDCGIDTARDHLNQNY